LVSSEWLRTLNLARVSSECLNPNKEPALAQYVVLRLEEIQIKLFSFN